MSFPKYLAYKDSGVEWIGEIPTKWRLVQLKSAARFVGGGTPSKDNLQYWNGSIPWVSPKDMKSDVIVDTEDHITDKAISETATQIVPSGNVLLVVRSGILRHTIPVAINAMEVALNQDMKCIIINHKLYDVHYIFRLIQGANSALLPLWSKQGATVESLEFDYISNTVFPLPPLSEQQEIASFLDRECGKIDTLIAEQERLIALLAEKRQAVISHAVTKGLNPNAPMKDSGTPLIGMVPNRWKCCRLRFVAEFNPSKTEISNFPFTEEVSFLPMESIGNDGSIDLSQQRKISDVLNGYTYFRDEDVIFAKITPCFENGKGALVKGLLKGIGFGTTELVVARAISSYVIPDYLFLFFQSYVFRQPTEASMYGAGGQKRVSEQFVRNFTIPLPPLPEQQAIANWVQHECGKIDALISEQKNMFSLLKERRAALISAAVTGKIDVRNQNKDNAA
ncbi:MAG: restriction endonuclease subunit S [Bifidobacteriales bacterium]|nr:restriction endonuclease subunit S [Bifidobacteriales bacterium]